MINRLDVKEEQKDWSTFFAEVIDETLKNVFKEDGTKVIYDFLEKQSQLKMEDAINKPDIFSDSLDKLMLSAASIIKQNILKNFYSKLGLEFEEKQGYKFSDYITELRKE